MGKIIPYMKWKRKNLPNHQPVFSGWFYNRVCRGYVVDGAERNQLRTNLEASRYFMGISVG